MNNQSLDNIQEELRPIRSLLSKSEKAREKLTPGTWQHTMLTKNISALQVASLLMTKDEDVSDSDLRTALDALSDMASRSEKALSKFEPGTSHHSLQRNRLNALHVAEAVVRRKVEHSNA